MPGVHSAMHNTPHKRLAVLVRCCRIMLHKKKCPTMDGGARRYAPRTVRKSRFRYFVKLYMHNSYSILTAKR